MSKFPPSQNVSALKHKPGTRESNILTMPAVGVATQGDYVNIYNAAGKSLAAFIDIDSDGTEPSGALFAASNNQATLAYKNAVLETYIITFPSTAAATQADYLMIFNAAGESTALNLDIDANTSVPSGANYVGSDNQIEVDIVGGGTATQNATLAFAALNGNVTGVGFTDNLDGTITVALTSAGPTTDAEPFDEDDSGAGSIVVGAITKGVLATTAIAGGALLAAVSLTDVTFADAGNGTVTASMDDIGNATDAIPKDADDSGAGSIGVNATDGTSESDPYPSPGDSVSSLSNDPSIIS